MFCGEDNTVQINRNSPPLWILNLFLIRGGGCSKWQISMIVEPGKKSRGHPYFFPLKFSNPKIKGKSSIIEGGCSRPQKREKSDFVFHQGGCSEGGGGPIPVYWNIMLSGVSPPRNISYTRGYMIFICSFMFWKTAQIRRLNSSYASIFSENRILNYC